MEKGERPAPFILRLVRDKSPTMRLAAATWCVQWTTPWSLSHFRSELPTCFRLCRLTAPLLHISSPSLTYLNRAGVIPEHNNDIMLTVLPILVKMLQLTGAVQETAPQVLGKSTMYYSLANFGSTYSPRRPILTNAALRFYVFSTSHLGE